MLSIAGYKIIAQISKSATSEIYRAIRIKDDLPVILKVLNQTYPTQEQLNRYQQEYEIMRSLNLSGVVKVYGLEKYHHTLIIRLEDFGGESLKSWMASRKFSLSEFLNLAIAIVEILGEIHAANIIHKDINPSNIIFNPATDEVKIIDFGIATVFSPQNTPSLSRDKHGTIESSSGQAGRSENLTVLEGTLAYMSPEQTGRMNCSVDYRTDFYELGVTLYELLTEQLPFNTTDTMELVHCHIAKQPVPPHAVNPEIPKSISDIVMKLLAKAADDRYQSAWGIQADLVICLMQLEANDEIEEIIPGENDVDEKFQIPPQIYGREREIEILLAALEPEAQITNTRYLILVKGDAGMGKSALVQEIAPKISQQGGYFIDGQFDQYLKSSYSALIKAFRELIKQLLTESEEQLENWRSHIIAAWGDNGQVIVDVIPELELIVGQQPPVPELPPAASENRCHQVWQNLLGVFAQPEHPLVIFLDNLQWADAASMKLMKLLMTAPQITAPRQHLCLIGGYRDNEVTAAHPLMLTIADLEKSGARVEYIELSALSLSTVTQLLCETLKCAPERAKYLAELVQQKTHGNPFFMKEFLQALYAKNLLYFDLQSRSWQWDMRQIKSHDITDNVVTLMADKMQKLTPSGQHLLQLAACIGNQFDLSSLARVSGKDSQETAQLLTEAIASGLIYVPAIEGSSVTPAESPIAYKFAHERIQQAAYAAIPEEDKGTIHFLVGQLLLRNTAPEKLEEKIFEIVYQLNLGVQLINRQSQRDELARLNLIAGKKAKMGADYRAAFEYLKVGLGLLDPDSWNSQYDLTLALYVEGTEIAYLSGDFEQMEKLAAVVLARALGTLEKVKVYEVKIQAYNAQKKLLAAVKTGSEILKQLGVKLPSTPRKFDICLALVQTKLALLGKPLDALSNMPSMTDERQLAAMRILHGIFYPAYLAVPELMPLIVFKQLGMSAKYGNAAVSAFAYANYGLILCGLGDIDAGYRFGQLALNMLPQVNYPEIKNKTIVNVNLFIKHWQHPLRETLEPLRLGYQSSMSMGDLEFAAYAARHYWLYSYYSGAELGILEKEMAASGEAIGENIYHQIVFPFRDKSQKYCRLNDLDAAAEDRDGWWGILYINKLVVCYLDREYSGAVSNAKRAEKYLYSLTGTPLVPIFYFYDSLTRLARYSESDNNRMQELDSVRRQVKANQKKMQLWAHHGPMNYLHKFYLVEAERHKVFGKDARAMELYDRAIALAKENEYINEAALGNECAANFYLAKGKYTIAKAYMQEARYCYRIWGATRKVKDLEERYEQLLNSKSELNTASATTKQAPEALDLTTVIKASQAISGEIVLDKLLEKLMKIIIENAGAQKGVLILPTDGKMLMEAEISVEPETVVVRRSQPLHNLPLTVINYVERTRSDVVLSNAAVAGRFVKDPYIAAKNLKSLLCTSILKGGQLIGILYLENNLTTNAFTTDRIKILRVLFAQAAISLENALFYANLEQKVADRTQEVNEKNLSLRQTLRELKRTQAQLIQTEKMSSMGQMVAGVAHEINNPVSFIYGNIDYARGYVQDLLDIINIYQQEYPNPPAVIQETIEDLDLDFLVTDLQKLLLSMKVGAERIRNIVLSLRNFSRLDESQRKQVDIHQGIESTLMLLHSRISREEGPNEIMVIKEYGKLPPVTCFASQLNQVFMNVIGNAIYALQNEQSPTITIRTEVTANDWVKISIADNGPGMTESVRQRIFDPFFTTKPVGSGTGLGLSISYQIVVESHGGQLNCVSAPGQGTELTISIPINSQ
ncbi:MAG: AAA family ATPase [Hormoscilla sp.]